MHYVESITQQINREAAFTYHPPQGDQAERYTQIRAAGRSLAELLNRLCPPGRELSVAQTKLQECVMWANAAIACCELAPLDDSPSAA